MKIIITEINVVRPKWPDGYEDPVENEELGKEKGISYLKRNCGGLGWFTKSFPITSISWKSPNDKRIKMKFIFL